MTSSFSEEYGSEEKKCRMGAIYKVVNAYYGVFLTYLNYFIAEGFLHLSRYCADTLTQIISLFVVLCMHLLDFHLFGIQLFCKCCG
jgi:hypothetical protein